MNLPISSWAIRNPIPVVVAFTLMLVAGAYSYSQLPVKQFPNISFPMVSATVIQEGAAPTELENQVTRLVENSIAGLPNIEVMQSSVSLGVSTTMIQFEIGVDLQKAKDDVEARVNQIRADLPPDIQPPRVNALDFTGGTLMTFAVSNPSLSPTDLSWFIDDTIARELQAVRGVGQVSRVGGVNREVTVTLDPVRMASLGVIAADVNNALQRQFRNYSGGRAEVGGAETTTRVLGETLTVEDLRGLTIPLRTGAYVKLSDVAEVGDGSGEIRSFARLNGRPVAGFNIVKVDSASEVEVERGVLAAIAKLEAQHEGLEITKIFSMTDDTKANFHATEAVLIEGMLLAALVVFLFLRDWRATVIAALAMPLSLIPTFFVISLFGFSLNVVTLLALTLVIGILVDDAIVEIENIQKRTLAGYTPFRAAMEGADAIGLAVLATTASIVVVFLPTSFMGGMPGQFFIEFGITVAVAVVFSLAVARFVSPLMAAYFLKATSHHRDVRKLPAFYEKSLAWALHHRWMASGIGGLSFLATVFFVAVLPKGFIPTEDPGYIMFQIDAPPGSTRAQMERAADDLNALLIRQPDVEDVFISIGGGGGGAAAAMGGGGGGAGLNSGSATVVMVDHHKMKTEELKQHIRPQLKQIADMRVTALMTGGGPGGSDVNILLTSDNAVELERTQRALLNEMKDLPQIQNPRLSPEPPGPELIIRPRTEEASRLSVSTDAIAQVARIATTGDIEANTPKFSEGERRLPIRVRLPDYVRNDLAELSQLRVPTTQGGTTTLGAVADLSYEAGPGNLQRLGRKREAAVQADFAPGITSGDATAAIDSTETMKAIFAAEAAGTAVVERARVGNEQAEAEMFGGIVIALLAGVALIYSVMVLLFKSVFKPMVILSSLPLSFSGAFLALLITGKEISMPVMIGCVLLLGIAAKNAILLVEFAIEAQRRGKNTYDALFEACRERARPIVMTTVAMSAGMLPTALALGAGAGFRVPMAVAVIGGLMSSTILSLVLVPVVYSFV
ncbi:MAG TPA: efflux RND transporter permease subunit, partial [Hyphomonadaceae bacterium]